MDLLIVVPNARSYYRVIKFITELLGRNPNPKVVNIFRKHVKVLTRDYLSLMKHREFYSRIIKVKEDANLFKVYLEAYLKANNKEYFDSLIIGIDPGMRIGVAVIGDGEVIDLVVFHSFERLERYIENIVSNCPFRICKIKIGNGEKWYEIATELKKSVIFDKRITMEIIDEGGSNSHGIIGTVINWVHDKDLASAIKIALSSD